MELIFQKSHASRAMKEKRGSAYKTPERFARAFGLFYALFLSPRSFHLRLGCEFPQEMKIFTIIRYLEVSRGLIRLPEIDRSRCTTFLSIYFPVVHIALSWSLCKNL